MLVTRESLGRIYLELREQGRMSEEACDIIREKYNITSPSVTIRSWATKAKRLEPGQRRQVRKKHQLETNQINFRLLPPLLELFRKECADKNTDKDSLMNMILFQRYAQSFEEK